MNQFVLITGATAGFGEAMARKFAQNGYSLIITGRRKDRLAKLQSELERDGLKIITLCFDIRDEEACKRAIQSLGDHLYQIEILINNAGLASGIAPIYEGDTEDWNKMIDTNVKGLLYITRLITPVFKEKRQGHIINISSTAAKTAYKNGNVYCATKFAVDAITQSTRIDMLPYGVKVTSVNPGMAETEFSLVRFHGDADRAKKVYEGFQPLKAEDVADTVYYCATLPAHVCINDLTITCLTQANSFYNTRTI